MNVLITGGGGFVGHHLLEYFLINTNWNIKIIESFRHGGTSSRLAYVLKNYSEYSNRVKVISHDLSTPLDNVSIYNLGDIDIIINVASMSSVDESITNPVYFINNNINLQLNILEYAKSLQNLKLFIQISTDEVYGSSLKEVKENQQFAPSNPYSASKASQESICYAYWKTYGLPIIITNTMNMFGERQSTKAFIPKTIEHILNNKVVPVYSEIIDNIVYPYSRFYLNIKNHADAIMFLIQQYINSPVKHEDGIETIHKFNITDGNELKNDQLVECIAYIMNIQKPRLYEYVNGVRFRPGHDHRYDLDGNKLTLMGWIPPYSFKESLEQTVNWFMANKEWLTI